MKFVWWLWFFCIGLVIAIPLQTVALAIWEFATKGDLSCGGVGATWSCGIADFIINASQNLIVLNFLSYGCYYLGTALLFSLVATGLVWKTRLANTPLRKL
jgi:hypothetical protein